MTATVRSINREKAAKTGEFFRFRLYHAQWYGNSIRAFLQSNDTEQMR